jgi:hypothetical protein
MVSCPVPAGGMHSMYRNQLSLYYLTNSDGSWNKTLVGSSVGQDGLYVDAQSVAHFSYFNNTASNGIHYLTNQSGLFVDEFALDTVSGSPSDVTTTSDGKIHIFAVSNSSNPSTRLFERLGNNTWTETGNIISTGGSVFTNTLLRSGPDTTLLAGAWYEAMPNFIQLRSRNSAGAWDGQFNVNVAGFSTCNDGTQGLNGLVDSNGKSHVVYMCNTGPSTIRLGYATNRTGSWTTTDIVGTSIVLLKEVAIDIDSAGTLHVFYVSNYGMINHVKGSSTSSLWQSTENIYASGEPIGSIAAAAVSPTVQHLLLTYTSGGVTDILKSLSNESGGWVLGAAIDNSVSGLAVGPTIFRR